MASQVHLQDIMAGISSVDEFIHVCIHTTKILLLAPEIIHTFQEIYRREQAIVFFYSGDSIRRGVHAATSEYCRALLALFCEKNWLYYDALSRTLKTHIKVYTGLLCQMDRFFLSVSRDYCKLDQREYHKVRLHLKRLFVWTSALDDLCLLLCRVSDGALVV
jgi:hypothetical protein